MSMTDFGHVPPDPRVKELEAENERLRWELKNIAAGCFLAILERMER